ncbi:D-2-hydroxyacid dehydrogenase [Lacrimispora sp.]|uniref:D-2-hydroxyacid dehydrogenase n=1 Tax=Lacrimispora sp. TaxID=2719234 RepID=UPI00289A9C44|nr:D-2-hydroxyacid dehydrogenase [Lacrimispora sp.]
MKIVVLDGYTENPGDLSWSGFESLGELTVYERTPAETIIERIGDAEAVIVNKTPICAEVLNACPGIRYVGVLATGYNVVDVKAAEEKGVTVTNIPAYGTASVAQFAFALLLEICHHVSHHSNAVYEGRWENNADWCFWDYPLIELSGKTAGIIGFGKIGQATGAIAKAMNMRVLAYGSQESESGRAIANYVKLDELLASSDVIFLHCPLFPETEGIINKDTIAKMKDGVILINNSRGPLIDEKDLAEALNTGKVYAAGVDVVSSEPIRGDNPLLTAKNCLITPHISWAPKESRERLMNIASENLRAFLEKAPVNVVNP